jgi:hypothetical protein
MRYWKNLVAIVDAIDLQDNREGVRRTPKRVEMSEHSRKIVFGMPPTLWIRAGNENDPICSCEIVEFNAEPGFRVDIASLRCGSFEPTRVTHDCKPNPTSPQLDIPTVSPIVC